MKRIRGVALTGLLVIAIITLVSFVWDKYMYTPWTRDARLRSEVIDIAPDVTGWVTELHFRNAQHINKGQIIFTIDPEHYKVTRDLDKAKLDSAKVAWDRAIEIYNRRKGMIEGDVSHEETVLAKLDADAKRTAYEEALAELDGANLNLSRTVYAAPVSGKLINLNLERGDYVTRGTERFALVKDNSTYVIGYFEESKLPRIRVGDDADIWLMAGSVKLKGHVVSIDPGIDNKNITPGNELLPQVEATFAWIRMAQRIPVNIKIDYVPAGVELSAGMSATVRINSPADRPSTTLQGWKAIGSDVAAMTR